MRLCSYSNSLDDERFHLLFLNHFSAVIIVLFSYFIYSSINFYVHFLSIKAWSLMRFFIFLFILFGWVPGLFVRNLREGKSLVIIKNLPAIFNFLISGKKPKLSRGFSLALKSVLVKFFYIPIMLQFTVGNYHSFLSKLRVLSSFAFNIHYFTFDFYPFLLSVLFFFDVLIFLFAYSVELPFLGNVVKSVEPTFLGWVVALMCYPPFNSLSSRIFGWGANDYAIFGSVFNTFIIRFFILLPLLVFYFSATLALNFKAGNLVNRGIVTSFPYSIVRHPAYASKTLFWFITSLSTHNFKLILSMFAWMCIYYLRGLTEENHLLMDPEYKKYVKKVKYRFFPYIL